MESGMPKKDMTLVVELDYRKAWDKSIAETVRMLKGLDVEHIRKIEAVVRDMSKQYWEKKKGAENESSTY